MRWFKRLLVICGVLGMALGAAYGYHWYQVKRYIDQQILQLEPNQVVTYERLWVDPRGVVTLEDLRIVYRGYPKPVTIARIRVRVDDPLFMFSPAGRIERGEWPGFTAVAVEQLRVEWVDSVNFPSEQAGVEVVDLNALACGDLERFTPTELRAMGLESLDLNLLFTAEVNPARGALSLMMDADLAGISHSVVELDLNYRAGSLQADRLMSAAPRLHALRLIYQDLGFYQKREAFCAQQSGVSEPAYRAAHLAAIADYFEHQGIPWPPLLSQAYQQATEKGSRIEVTLQPPGGFGFEGFAELGSSPAHVVDRLGVQVMINTQPLDLAAVNWAGLAPKSRVEPEEDQTDSAESDEPNPPQEASTPLGNERRFAGIPDRPVVLEKRYQATAYEDLGSYLESDIRIITYYGNIVEGRLLSADSGQITILHRLDRGLAVYPVERDKLQVIEVFRR